MRRKQLAWQVATATALLVVAATRPRPVHAQDAAWRPVPDTARKHTVQVWGGYSPASMRLFGLVRGARFATLGARLRRALARSSDGARVVEYVGELLPVVTMTYEPVVGAPPAAVARGERTLYGLGVMPVGVRLRGAGEADRWRPYLGGGIGAVYFAAPLPDRRGKRFNFVFRVGIGVRLRLGAGATVMLGYRFHHLSNGFRGRINPGFDSNVFHLGATVAQF